MQNRFQAVEFISANAAGIVNVELGFEPDFAILIKDHGSTNPNVYIWANNARMSGWAEDLALLITGSSGVITRDTADTITVFTGGNKITSAETANSDPKHIDLTGTPAAAGHIAAAGLAIASQIQANSGRNLLLAFGMER